MGCTMANIIAVFTETNPIATFALVAVGNPPLLCVVGNYLLIHLREAAGYCPDDETTQYLEPQQISSIRYDYDQISDMGAFGKASEHYPWLLKRTDPTLQQEQSLQLNCKRCLRYSLQV